MDGHGGQPPAGLLAALVGAPAQVTAVGDAIAQALIGPLALVASVNVTDPLTARIAVVGAAAWNPEAARELRAYLEAASDEARHRFNGPVMATGRPQVTDLRAPRAGLPERRPAFLGREVAHNLNVPLRNGAEILGTVQVARAEPYSDAEVAAVVAAGELCGPAVDNARLLRRLRREERITRAMAGNIGLDELFAAVLPELREVVGADTVRLLLLSDDGQTLHGGLTLGMHIDERDAQVPVGAGFAGRIAAERRALVVEDLARYPVHSAPLRRSGLVSLAGVPVMDADVLGVLHMGSFTPRRFTAEDLDLLQLVADRLALALAQSRVAQRLERTRALAQSVLDAAADAILTFDARGIVRDANRSVQRLFGYGREEVVGRPVAELVPDLQPERLDGTREAHELTGRRRDGRTVPVDLSVSEVIAGSGVEQRLFTAFLRDASERRAAEARLRHQAMHDALTDLPNRALFGEHLARAVARHGREERHVAVMFLDLDRFKLINDSLGHAAGDELLRQVAERLRGAVRPTDVLARLGGDEFAVLLEGIMPLAATTVARRVLDRFRAPFVLEGRPLHVATSIGIAHTADERHSAGDLLRHADAAMYRAKAQGRGRFDIFDSSMRARLHRRLTTESELHGALSRGEIDVHYQPVLDLRTNRVVRLEALARWHHPRRGTLAARDFIGVAEETGLIKALGVEVTRRATQQLGVWREELGDDAPQVAINLSPSQLAVPLEPIVQAASAELDHLAIEITESALMQDADRVAGQLRALKERGATVVIDDFGTGYSSLSSLRRLPIDVIKIDRSLVDGLDSGDDGRAIVTAIISLAHALGITVVAEGVESQGQLALLDELGCDLVQGYAISPPRPAADVFAVTG